MTSVRVQLPAHLRTLADVESEVRLEVDDPPTVGGVLDALERRFPVLRGTIRDRDTGERRALMRFYASGHDVSHASPDTPLPSEVADGEEAFQVVGAIAGGRDRPDHGVPHAPLTRS